VSWLLLGGTVAVAYGGEVDGAMARAEASLAVPWGPVMLDALHTEEWGEVCARNAVWAPASQDPRVHADHSFVSVWVGDVCDDGRDIRSHLARALAAPTPPEAYRTFLEGRTALAQGEISGAETLLGLKEHPVLGARALQHAGRALQEAGQTDRAVEAYFAVRGTGAGAGVQAEALEFAMDLAPEDIRGPEWYRELWKKGSTTNSLDSHFSGSSVMQDRLNPTARDYNPAAVADRMGRVVALADLGRYHSAVDESTSLWNTEFVDGTHEPHDWDEADCSMGYARGKSLYRTNRWTEAIAVLSRVGEWCVGVEDATGASAWYLVGTMRARRGHHGSAAQAYAYLVHGYPEHSMADDALTRGGIALQEEGDRGAAKSLWARALEDYPQGDTTPDAAWRLAFAHYDEGDAEGARRVAQSLAQLGEVHGQATWAKGSYWAARWLLYPDVQNPNRLAESGETMEGALSLLKEVVEGAPYTVHSTLAASRLMELAPAYLQEPGLSVRAWDGEEDTWVVRASFLEDPCVDAGLKMAKLGLLRESQRALECADSTSWSAAETGLVFHAQQLAGGMLETHMDLRYWLKEHPPGTLGDADHQILGLAYPDLFWDEVREASAAYAFPPRLLHALVREESAFDADVVSFAGAVGLAQLMPATAVQTANWLDEEVDPTDLEDPATNLALGARYLSYVHGSFGNNPALALAAYNAGPHRVRQWVQRFGNVPVDEFMERIPFHETRGYVSRVLGTYQMLRWRSAMEPVHGDLSSFNQHVLP